MIRLKWSELKYDVELQTYNISQMRMSDRQLNPRNYDEVVTDESLEDMILRFCETGNAMLKTLLRDKAEQVTNLSDNTDALNRDKTEWTYTITDSSLAVDEQSLAMLFHRYVVAWCLWKWAQQFSVADATQFASEATALAQDIKNGINQMGTPLKYHPHKECPVSVEIEYS